MYLSNNSSCTCCNPSHLEEQHMVEEFNMKIVKLTSETTNKNAAVIAAQPMRYNNDNSTPQMNSNTLNI